MKRVLIGLATVAALVAVAVAVFYFWAVSARDARLAQIYDVHLDTVPVPTPLSAAEVAALQAPEAGAAPLSPAQLQQLARQRAMQRGKHLLEARYACFDCHGQNLGGGVMVDDPMVGRFLGPNITQGQGSVTLDYTIADWDRIIRHGVGKKKTAVVMPSHDFVAMSDQELSDILTYILALPPVDNEVASVSFGPIGTVLIAMGQFPLTAEAYAARTEHPKRPPPEDDLLAFGRHLAQTCIGCHGPAFAGGSIPGGAPDWPSASNLTPSGRMNDWTYEDFARLMREGVDPQSNPTRMPMTLTLPMNRKMTEIEMKALFTYLKTLAPAADS